ncbi:universal stress protein [Demequina sp. NBRC 110057]|uniref:universal stress protein n=1 Tax=Demequina sp. NBRC 110057 TaxID=1570346 RepID=UPI000A06C3C7|nr:universal stress protein [Demequina sp. NBRC 110057]
MTATAHVVVGVVPGQPDAVVTTAASLARLLGAEVACAWVDSSRLAIERRLDGSVVSVSMSVEINDAMVETMDPELEHHLGELLDGAGAPWTAHALAGLPSQQLGDLADELDAAMIVVGTREPGLRGSLHEFFSGSVAAQLSHRQHRPVLVVPLAPVGLDAPLPWEPDENPSP